jgi:hypothetical protein
LPGLPPEAARWVVAADEFEAGQLGVDALTAVRVTAWQFHDARAGTSPSAELSGLRAVMYRLWPEDRDWHESGWYFLRFLQAAGVREDQWFQLLRGRFSSIFGGSQEAEPLSWPTDLNKNELPGTS